MRQGSSGRPITFRPLDRLSSIRAKFGSVVVFAVGVTILTMYLAVGFALRTSERDREFRELVAHATAVSATAFGPDGEASPALAANLRRLPYEAVVVDARGRRVAGTLDVPASAHALRGAMDGGVGGGKGYLGVPVVREGAVVGAVYVAHDVEDGGVIGAISGTAAFVQSVWWQLLLAGAVSAFTALALARFLARGMTQPLRDMAQAARGMARGDYSQRVRARSRDEVGQLALAFNRMAGELEGVERLRRDLVANVSHELKTPIAALRAQLENLLDGVEKPTHEVLAVMLQQSERLSRLVEELLDLSRLDSGDVPLKMEPVALAPLVDAVATEVQVAHAGRGVAVHNDVPSNLVPLHADRERLYQVLFNLIDNAVRFSPPGGVVRVTATRRDRACEVTVEDAGPGIRGGDLQRVFERFYRVDPSRSRSDGGTGIGLTIAKSVVEAHGGRIWAENGAVDGAALHFLIPLEQSLDDDADARSRPSAQYAEESV